ncbi:hypothetical protein ACKKBG_A02640 [Auxenochlorella protothecoides x Auxenochlorella symbiontica]
MRLVGPAGTRPCWGGRGSALYPHGARPEPVREVQCLVRSKDTLMKEGSRIPGRHGGLPTSMTSLSWTSGRQGSVACRSLPKDEAWYEPVEEESLVDEDGSVIVRDDLEELLKVLPPDLRGGLCQHPHRASLLEVVLDLGRRPEARFLNQAGGEVLRERPVDRADLDRAMAAVGEFGGDNRAGITGTLHRISAIRNRKGSVVGLTCRVGRAVTGHMDMLADILQADPTSLLFLGRPGVGKTTVIRELARSLADDHARRVIIIDTSNEIGGDGDVPHPGIGGARRMQVPDPSAQHAVMIEAVENHMPQVVIVDEIGTAAEALACRTIAERGVMLVATAHGQTLGNLIKNPTLSDLVGGVTSVTLGDDEARARGSQKSVLERCAPATFPVVIEMRERARWVTHWVEESVDCLLAGRTPMVQLRTRDAQAGGVVVERARYDAGDGLTGDSGPNPLAQGGPASLRPGAGAGGAFDAMFGAGVARNGLPRTAGVGAVEESRAPDPFAWATRLREVPDEDALTELSALGLTGSAGSGGAGWQDDFSSFSTSFNKKKKRSNPFKRS